MNECDSIKWNFPRIKMIQYFPKPHEQFRGDINVKVDLSNYCNKNRYQNYFTCWYFKFLKKSNLASLKTEVDQLDTDKLVPVPVDLRKLSDIVKNDVVKKLSMINQLKQVNNIDTSRFV